MEAGELRIGNYIKYKGTIIPVTAVYIGQPTLKDAEPIQLTPEILEAVGFKYDGLEDKDKITYWDVFLIDRVFSIGQYENEFYFIDVVLPDTHYKTPLRNLHQLQNLYFALTGEELTVNLKETKEAVLIWNHLAQITTGL